MVVRPVDDQRKLKMKSSAGSLMRMMEHKRVRLILIVLLVAYSAVLLPAYNDKIAPLFDSWVIRTLFVLTILVVISQDLVLGVLLLLG